MSSKVDQTVYQLEGKPKLKYAILFGLQHILAMFVSNVAPILIIANAVGLSPEQTRIMVQAAMLTSGAVTMLNVYGIKIGKFQIGSRLPMFYGVSFAFVSVSSLVGEEFGLGAVIGASIAAAVIEIIIGVFYKYIRHLFNPLVTGSLLVALGLYLIGVGGNYFIGGFGPYRGTPQALITATVVLLVVLGVRIYTKGVLRSSAVLIGIVVGYILSIALGMVNFDSLRNLDIVSFKLMVPFAVAKPDFILAAIIPFVIVYFASAVETIGDTKGVALGGLNREATHQEISGGLIADGFGSVISSAFNALPNTSFGQNVGIITSTKIVNKHVIGAGAAILMLVSFFPTFSEFMRLIPDAVLGGALITVFAIITANGLKLIGQAGTSDKNLFILAVAFALGMGLGGNVTFIESVPGFIGMFFSTTVAATTITAIIASVIIKPDYSKGTYNPNDDKFDSDESSYIEE
jgi:NCS2 family nucleobase:cation symporter-2